VGPRWDYAIRTNVSIVPPTYPQVGFVDPLLVGVNTEYVDDYMMSGFLTLQLQVARAIVSAVALGRLAALLTRCAATFLRSIVPSRLPIRRATRSCDPSATRSTRS
jgi:hypothetical protein